MGYCVCERVCERGCTQGIAHLLCTERRNAAARAETSLHQLTTQCMNKFMKNVQSKSENNFHRTKIMVALDLVDFKEMDVGKISDMDKIMCDSIF